MDENIINNNTDKIKLSVIVPIYNVENYVNVRKAYWHKPVLRIYMK